MYTVYGFSKLGFQRCTERADTIEDADEAADSLLAYGKKVYFCTIEDDAGTEIDRFDRFDRGIVRT